MLLKFRQKMFHWLQNSVNNECEPAPYYNTTAIGSSQKVSAGPGSPGKDLDSAGIHFKVIPGQGGTVIETFQYNKKTDNRDTTLYVVPDTDDLSQAITHIITLQSMRG
jgi:hypothetical protein